jgi:hypothetical protein
VAQSVARGVWDAEVGGSSPLTPTLHVGEGVSSSDCKSLPAPEMTCMTELRSGSFEALVSRPDTHVVLDLATESRTLLILFGGIAGGVSMPVFEFFRITADFPVKKAFLRDPRRGWYQLGVPGVGDSAEAVKSLLDDVIARADVDRVIMAGASAGGFAALLFGAACQVDEVIAFSPQTFVDAENRSHANDARWPEQIATLHATVTGRDLALDLLEALPTRDGKTRFQVHVSADDELDVLHARRVADRHGVHIIEHERGGHRLVKTLRDRGILEDILRQAIAGADMRA